MVADMSDPILSLLNDRLDSYIKDLNFLVSIDSGSFDKAGVDAVNDWLEDRLTRTGFITERHTQKELGDNILGVIKGKGRGKILLIGHADTVFPLGTAQERPMKIEGDKILGPGTCDMKAGLLAGVYAIETLNQRDFNNYESITYLCVSDEEIGGARQSKPLLQSEARKADVALTLEAARENGDIVSARKGLCWYTLEAFGKSAVQRLHRYFGAAGSGVFRILPIAACRRKQALAPNRDNSCFRECLTHPYRFLDLCWPWGRPHLKL